MYINYTEYGPTAWDKAQDIMVYDDAYWSKHKLDLIADLNDEKRSGFKARCRTERGGLSGLKDKIPTADDSLPKGYPNRESVEAWVREEVDEYYTEVVDQDTPGNHPPGRHSQGA